jgi:FAD synthase
MSQQVPIQLQGSVTKFKGNGRKLGYPTANIAADTDLEDGIYFGFADLQEFKHQPALIFIGTPVTVGDTERRVEAYLFDIPDTDYYGADLALEVQHYHRPNQNFPDLETLIAAIQADETAARQWFAGVK